MKPDALLEAILFAAAGPLPLIRLSEFSQLAPDEVGSALDTLESRLREGESGLMLLRHGKTIELVTRPEAAESVAQVLNAEASEELTRPALETLTILAYCGPLTRPELEQLRGVHSALILRNLLIRGLVEQGEETRVGQPVYVVTSDFLRHLGLSGVSDLPDFEAMRDNATIQEFRAQQVRETNVALPPPRLPL